MDGQEPVPGIAMRNLRKAIRLAEIGGCTTALITSKGEPLNNLSQIDDYLYRLNDVGTLPIVELQTNGIDLQGESKQGWRKLARWRELGLSTVAISCVGVDRDRNQAIYDPKLKLKDGPWHLMDAARRVLDAGLICRLTVTMYAGGVDSAEEVSNIIHFCATTGIQQVTFGAVNCAEQTRDSEASAWAKAHVLAGGAFADMLAFITANGTPLLSLMHNAKVWDIEGVSVCVRNCLTTSQEPEEIRLLIYWPDGKVTYDWQYEGARLI